MLAGWLRAELGRALAGQGQAGLVVWYDAGGTLESLAEGATPEGARLLRFEGSYLALRFGLEAADPEFQGRWVVYLPEAPPKESWLRDWELFGVRLELDLADLLRRGAGLEITPRLEGLLRHRPENARELVRAWEPLMAGVPVNEANLLNALLALGLGLPRWQPEQALLLLSGRGRRPTRAGSAGPLGGV